MCLRVELLGGDIVQVILVLIVKVWISFYTSRRMLLLGVCIFSQFVDVRVTILAEGRIVVRPDIIARLGERGVEGLVGIF